MAILPLSNQKCCTRPWNGSARDATGIRPLERTSSCTGSRAVPDFVDFVFNPAVVFPTPFLVEGVKFDLSSILSPNFQTSHSLAWGSAPATYHFGTGFSTPSVSPSIGALS